MAVNLIEYPDINYQVFVELARLLHDELIAALHTRENGYFLKKCSIRDIINTNYKYESEYEFVYSSNSPKLQMRFINKALIEAKKSILNLAVVNKQSLSIYRSLHQKNNNENYKYSYKLPAAEITQPLVDEKFISSSAVFLRRTIELDDGEFIYFKDRPHADLLYIHASASQEIVFHNEYLIEIFSYKKLSGYNVKMYSKMFTFRLSDDDPYVFIKFLESTYNFPSPSPRKKIERIIEVLYLFFINIEVKPIEYQKILRKYWSNLYAQCAQV